MNFRIWERIRDWLLLFLLLILAVGVMIAENEPMVRALRRGALETTAWVEARFAWVGNYFRALDENELLREENIELASEVARSREARMENERLRRMIGFQDTTAQQLISARIVDKDITRQQNYLTLNVGRADSVEVDMAVVDERGILGTVVDVSENYARVMPYLNTDFRVPAKILPLEAAGVVRWEGDRRDRLLMEFVSRTEPVLPGQLVVTSGYSGTFPAGYPVGFVDSVATRPGRNNLLIYLQPVSPIDRAEYAFVVLERPDPEQLRLEGRQLTRQ